jgi:hypothetical protein
VDKPLVVMGPRMKWIAIAVVMGLVLGFALMRAAKRGDERTERAKEEWRRRVKTK